MSSENEFIVSGKIVSEETGEPIEFVNIFIDNHPFGVISNINGEFVFYIPVKYKSNNIIFSCMGYESDTIAVKKINSDHKLLIELTPKKIILEEITVKPVNPLDILREVIKRIPVNYPDNSINMYAYYREMVKVDTSFVKYTDAACEIYYCSYDISYDEEIASSLFFKADYNSFLQGSLPFPQAKHIIPHQNDAVKIIELRKSNNLEHFENRWGFEENLKKFDIGGGPLHITAADIVKFKNDFLDSLSWKHYQFMYKGILTYNNRDVYKISFRPDKTNRSALWEGYMYIDKYSFALISYEYNISEKCVKYLKDKNLEYIVELTRRKTRKQTGKQLVKRKIEHTDQRVRVNYTLHQSKWYLSHIKVENTFNNTGDLFEDINYETYLELVVNNVETRNVIPFKTDAVFHTNKYNYMFNYPQTYNPKFWETFNTPLPSGIYKEAMKDIEKKKTLEEQFME